MDCIYKFEGKEYTEPEIQELLSKRESKLSNGGSYYFDPELRPSVTSVLDEIGEGIDDNVPRGDLPKLIHFKTNALRIAESNLNKVNSELYNPDIEKTEERLEELQRRKLYLNELIEGDSDVKDNIGLKNEIDELKNIDSKSTELITPFIENDFIRLDTLIASNSEEDLKEAEEIIRFLKALSDFNPSSANGHPIFTAEELYDKNGELKFTQSMLDTYYNWARRADEYGNKLEKQQQQVTIDTINNNDTIKEWYNNPLTFKQITDPLNDISWIDMMIMDITGGITSKDNYMPQVIKGLADSKFLRDGAWAVHLSQKLDEILPQVEEELRKMGYELKRLGIPLRGVSYDLFKQVTASGEQTGNMIDKYSHSFSYELSQVLNKFMNEYYKVQKIDNPVEASNRGNANLNTRNAWIKGNTIVLNPSLISEIINDPEFSVFSHLFNNDSTAIAKHEKEIKDQVGEKYYPKLVEEQKRSLRDFRVISKVKISKLLGKYEVNTFDELPEKVKKSYKVWEAQNSPFLTAKYINSGRAINLGDSAHHQIYMNHTILVPRRIVDNKESDYYDSKYQQVENNTKLSEFYDTIRSGIDKIRNSFDADTQKEIDATFLPFLKKTTSDVLLDNNLNFWQAISSVFRKWMDDFKAIFGIKVGDPLSWEHIDAITGKPVDQINDSFITQNRGLIKSLFKIKAAKFLAEYNSTIPVGFQIKTLNKFTTVKENPFDVNSKTIEIGRHLYEEAQHEVAKNMSFDLPKIIKTYSALASQYSARREMLPLISLMKNHYTDIKKNITTNTGENARSAFTGENRLDDVRANAVRRFNYFYDKIILGKYDTDVITGKLIKREGLDPDIKAKLSKIINDPETSKQKKIAASIKMWLNNKFDGKIYNREEKRILKTINEAIEETKNDTSEEGIKRLTELKNIRNKLGKDFSLLTIPQAILTFNIYRGLSYNLSSGMNNFIEGQIANHRAAISGLYFPAENIYAVTPVDLMRSDSMSKFNKALAMPKVVVSHWIMEHFDLLQDRTNDNQKSSAKSALAGIKNNLHQFFVMKKGEEFNQTPLSMAIAKFTKIFGKDNVEGNLLDSLQAEWDEDHKVWKISFKDEFNTEENRDTWLHLQGKNAANFKNKVKAAIKDTHGDYDNTSATLAKKYFVGKVFMMFKGWLPREWYKRWGKEQNNILSGIRDQKGSYRSLTKSTAFTLGMVAFLPITAPWVALAASLGMAGGAHFFGSRSSVGPLNELVIQAQLLLRKMMGVPLNSVSRLVNGKAIVSTNAVIQYKSGKFKLLRDQDIFDRLSSKDFTKIDYANFKANIQDIAVLLGFMAMTLSAKAMLWDDEDDGDDDRRKAHNLLVNNLMSLTDQATSYLNILAAYKSTTDLGMARWLQSVSKLGIDFGDLLSGNDIQTSGINSGKSKSYIQLKKVALPSILNQSDLGFGASEQRQFQSSAFDKYFHNQEYNAKHTIMQRRAEAKLQIENENPDLEDKEIRKILNQEIPRKKKGQTYSEELDSLDAEDDTEN